MLPSSSKSFDMIGLVASFGWGGSSLAEKRGSLYRSRKQNTRYINAFGLGKERRTIKTLEMIKNDKNK